MSNVFNLDSLREELDREFAPLQITVGTEDVTLQNLMRINKKDRAAVLENLKVVEAADEKEEDDRSVEEIEELSAAVENILKSVCANGKGGKLIQALDGDLMLAMKIMEMWTEATQPGEAENSPA